MKLGTTLWFFRKDNIQTPNEGHCPKYLIPYGSEIENWKGFRWSIHILGPLDDESPEQAKSNQSEDDFRSLLGIISSHLVRWAEVDV